MPSKRVLRRHILKETGSADMKKNFATQAILIMLLDAFALTMAGGLAFLARFEFSIEEIPREFLELWYHFLPLQISVTWIVFWLMRMYHFVWRSVSAHDVLHMVLAVIIAYAAFFAAGSLLGDSTPRGVLFIEFLCELFFLVGMRCCLRMYGTFHQTMYQMRHRYTERVMLIGAGEAGRMLTHEFLSSPEITAKLCCIVDDNRTKWGKYIEGVPIIGGRGIIRTAAKRENITQIILAIPGAPVQQKKEILEICKHTGCRIRILPGIYQIVNGEVSLASVQDVQVEDLLGREPVRLNTQTLDEFLHGKTVLVTGGGGSIGSELCRQIARYEPRTLVVLDIYENNAYDIQQELHRAYGDQLDLRVEIASIRDKERVYEIFDRLHPDVVFHAAAHKHVPLMEACPEEAIKNNIFGTYHVVRAAEKYGTKKFVMISTDKAVNPTNVMGATKRFCEMVLQSRQESGTEFCAVRFGNVLGSNGSVVPLFKKQIEAGGPVEITDKRIIRYFMTIPEAAQLVLEAGAMARQSQIFVLDMGEPVKILDLAENMIRLSGLEPYRDIEIREIGLRPGEKLYEELLMKSETLLRTANDKIFVEQQQRINPARIMEDLEALDRAVTDKLPEEELVRILRGMIPTYHAPETVNARAEEMLRRRENGAP